MNGSNARSVPEINLDEFERRLRTAGAPQEGIEDPLAELTRLVDMITRDNDNEQRQAESPAVAAPPPPVIAPPRLDFDRASPPPLPRAPQMEAAAPEYEEPDPEPFALSHEERADLLAATAKAPAGRAGAWYFKTAGLAIVGVALFGGAAALKFGIPRAVSRTPPFIAAAEGPTKIQPPSDATVQSAGDAGALLTKDSTTTAPTKVVSNTEEPVDLRAQTPSSPPSPAVDRGLAPVASTSASSPVAPAADTPIVAPGESTATVAPLFPDAKPVKTVSVRPDGSLISTGDGSAPSPPPSPAAKTAIRVADNNADTPVAVAPQPATPKLDLPTKMPPKSTARVAKTDTTAPAGATDTTPNAPAQVGSTTAPSKPETKQPAAAPQQVADAAATDPAATSDAAKSGGWAVQFAAPRSEADAKKDIARLKAKYADALGDSELDIHKADVKGETIFRVRAGGLSKADAAALCSKLKASGGDCFIAKN